MPLLTATSTFGLGRRRRFRDIASYLSKVADFYLPHLHLAPPVEGVTPENFAAEMFGVR